LKGLAEPEAGHILVTGAEAVFSGNVGCLLQIQRYLRRRQPGLWVAHSMDARWASYRGQR
jgi:glycolate oxidase iron-sulfur subunit